MGSPLPFKRLNGPGALKPSPSPFTSSSFHLSLSVVCESLTESRWEDRRVTRNYAKPGRDSVTTASFVLQPSLLAVREETQTGFPLIACFGLVYLNRCRSKQSHGEGWGSGWSRPTLGTNQSIGRKHQRVYTRVCGGWQQPWQTPSIVFIRLFSPLMARKTMLFILASCW